MENVARIVLAMEHHDVAEEVMHFLDRSGHARVVATATDHRQVSEAIRQLEPDAVVGQPSLVPDVIGTRSFLAVETRESVGALRSAIRAGAEGFFLWPAERDALLAAAAATRAAPVSLDRRAAVIAVHAARGGAGATFVATHLARAFARRGKACVLIDGDPLSGDVNPAVGAPEEDVHTLADLVPLGGELTTAHLDETLWTHPDGFRVLLTPSADAARSVEPSHVRHVVDVASTATDAVVLHLPHAIDEHTRAGVETADRIVEVISLDVLSFRSTKRALDVLRLMGVNGVEEKLGFVVNRASRAEITPRDVVRVFGREPLAVIPADHSAVRAQDHGRLVPARGRTGRAFERMAGRLEGPVS